MGVPESFACIAIAMLTWLTKLLRDVWTAGRHDMISAAFSWSQQQRLESSEVCTVWH